MAGIGWNMRQGNMHELESHGRKSPFGTTQIACRICDQVFLSTQSLISHIETHMVPDETVAAIRQNELNQLANPNFQNNFPLQTQLQPVHSARISQQRNPYLVPNPPTLLNHFPVPPANLLLLSTKHQAFWPQLPRTNFGLEAVQIQQHSSSEFTKPLLDQLQTKMVDDERDNGNNRVYDSEMLDLTLKL